MKNKKSYVIPILMNLIALAVVTPALAAVIVQCPGDTDGDAIIDVPDMDHPNAKCMHLGAGDGFATMADGTETYIFSFTDLTGVDPEMAMQEGMLAATFPAPLIALDEGDEFYLTLTNVGMHMRPDLFDPHTVHWHGFPEAAPVFDGVPDASLSIIMGSSYTYYYNVVEPGTFMYHCHVEATEHMQMGMLGNLYVRPAQNRLPNGTILGTHVHNNPDNLDGLTLPQDDNPVDGDKYVYNDGDGSTRYDVEYPVQMGSFDPDFHEASITTQPLPFALMEDKHAMLNGRGYPDTINPNPLPAPEANGGKISQYENSLIVANAGEKIALRISNLNVTRFYTLSSLSIPMTVIGKDSRLLRATDPDGVGPLLGENLYYNTNSITLGGGEAVDVILDTNGPDGLNGTADDIPPGTYFLYTTNLNYLSNNQEDLGGMLTEIKVN